ncbi:MAG: hypothetical protein ACREBU_00740 [Nitrososphaera sp.]
MPSSKIRIAAIIGSLAALAIILSPIFSLPSFLQNPGGVSDILSEEPVNETAIAPPEISEENFVACNSVNDDVQAIMVDVDESRVNATRKIAADLLLGEYCNRPALVHEINATGYPGLSLVAYACDAGSGKVGDTQLKDSLVDHRAIYCESAGFSIQQEAESLRASVEGFRDDFIQSLKEDDGVATNAELIAELEASVGEILSMVDNVQSLVTAGDRYGSVKMLDSASTAFEDLLERVEQSG